MLIGLDRHLTVIGQLARSTGAAAIDADVGPTARELCVLALMAGGHTTPVIAHRLRCSPRTVRKHLDHVYWKLASATG